MNKPVFLSDHALTLAEQRARAEGYASVEDYVGALIESDSEDSPMPDWMRRRIADGLASPSADEMTREKLDGLVAEGVISPRCLVEDYASAESAAASSAGELWRSAMRADLPRRPRR